MADFHADILIIGGGIAGLWTLAQARQKGYNAILVEKNALGGGQSMASQGIIHGGSKYALGGKMTEATSTISRMPAIWRMALNGEHDVDLGKVQLLSDKQFLLPSAGIDTQLLSFLGSRSMASFTETVKACDLPDAYQAIGIRRKAFRLNEMVVDTRSVFATLAEQYQSAIFQADIDEHALHYDAKSNQQVLQLGRHRLLANIAVLAAGAGNAAFTRAPAMQRRPLHMVMARGKLPAIYAHFIGRSSKPLLTITSHPAGNDTIWYMGGDLAEKGVDTPDNRQIDRCRQLLGKLLPAVNIQACRFATFHIDRAEPRQGGLKRPDDAFVSEDNGIITGWPTKLALAPRFADKVLDAIALQPHKTTPAPPELPLARPPVADYPWSNL